MRATYIHGAGDIRIETVPDPVLIDPTDAIVRIVRACICGSDLHPYHSKPAGNPRAIGHEFIGIVEDTGSAVHTVKRGDFVIAPFVWSDGTCEFCREGLFTSCLHGGDWGDENVGGGQGEATRVPFADGTLVPVPGITEDSPLLPSLLTLSDVYGTGYHAAVTAGVRPGETVAVIGDGAVGLLAVLAAKQLGAERIILMGRHQARTDLGREFGATDVVSERGEEGIAKVRELSGGHGAHRVLEAVGFMPAYEQALGVVRPGGAISRVGVPQYAEAPAGRVLFSPNVTLTGGVAPVRKYIGTLLPAVLDGTVNPGRVFDKTVSIEDVPAGYVAMDERTALKVLIAP
ncbi:IMP dehydrogenase [Mycetocola tolaasinivorans]|uniref:IMP dehydrogenase n=1 Tax=Mycetocola tolaasinivorans TaxID=76635 RepID=A0A3L7ACJ6_9MICO|nr:alcohol dehydrogenase catalytic domain-containing protein [Mycetocola tolaasinivorans]RLP77947.1 IMP dehydrogenase [Mycetocola tolaasinivorans]